MAARLGDVLYWLSCGVAALCLLTGGFVFMATTMKPDDQVLLAVIVAISAGCSWAVGRALRYVLAGR